MMNGFTGGILDGFFIFHAFFNLVFLLGFILFAVWLVQFLLKKKQILLWAGVFLIFGILGLFFTFRGGTSGMMFGNQYSLNEMFEHMLDDEHEEIDSPEDFRDHMIEEMREHMGIE